MRKKRVKVINLLAEEDKGAEEKQWLSAITHNLVFDFLQDEGEDIYSLTDGNLFLE